MENARKQMRMLTVSEASNYGRKTAPMLRIQGLWFQKLGFNVGDPVLVQCEEGIFTLYWMKRVRFSLRLIKKIGCAKDTSYFYQIR